MAPEWRIRYEHKVDDKHNGAEVDRNNQGQFAIIGFAANPPHTMEDSEIDHIAFDEIMHLVTYQLERELKDRSGLSEETIDGLIHAVTNRVYRAVRA